MQQVDKDGDGTISQDLDPLPVEGRVEGLHGVTASSEKYSRASRRCCMSQSTVSWHSAPQMSEEIKTDDRCMCLRVTQPRIVSLKARFFQPTTQNGATH